MSKELEALNIIEDTRDDLKILRDFDDAVALLRKALTPPTADEVCKALSEYYGKEVIYRDTFYVALNKYEDCNLYNYLDINTLKDRPDLITLIGRFYEGEIK